MRYDPRSIFRKSTIQNKTGKKQCIFYSGRLERCKLLLREGAFRNFCPSHGLSVADNFVAVVAFVLLIVASWNAEGDEAAAEPAANEAEDEAEDPGKSSLHLIHVGVTGVSAELASHSHGVVRPVGRRVGTAMMVFNNDDVLALHGLSRSHHRLARHWLSLHGHTGSHHWLLWGVHRLSHLLRSVHGLLLEHRLCLSDGLAGQSVCVVNLL